MSAQPTTADPTHYEYKILRSATAIFKTPSKFRAVLEEEARAGWELVEKFDDSRVRLRRHIAWRDADSQLTQDPYRIKVGMTDGVMTIWWILGLIFLVVIVVFLTSRR